MIREMHENIREQLNIGQAQYFPPEAIDSAINSAINKLFNQEIKHFEANNIITHSIGHYKTKSATAVPVTDGVSTIDSDYMYLTDIQVTLSNDSVTFCEILKDSEWSARVDSEAFAPSNRHPVARIIGGGKVEFLPSTVKSARYYYLRKPAVAKYGYTVNGTSIIYDPNTTVEIDWPAISHDKIQDKAIGFLATVLRDQFLAQKESLEVNQDK